jgi:heptose I phosphotransferase
LFAGPDWADHIMGVQVSDRFQAKQGRTTGRWVLQAPDGPARPSRTLTVYLKRHYRLPWWHGWLATVWPYSRWSPALQEWDNLEWARRQGLPVPQPLAAAEFVGPWGRLQSVLAVEELAGMMPLSEAIPLAFRRLDPVAFRHWKRGLVAEVARLTRLLHDRRYFHKDLYLCHFFLSRQDTATVPESWRGRVFLIDLHRLACHPWTWRLWQMKDLAQLLYSAAIPGLSVRDQVYFWQQYCGTSPGQGAGRWLRRGILIKCQRYRYHNARHRAAKAEERGSTK